MQIAVLEQQTPLAGALVSKSSLCIRRELLAGLQLLSRVRIVTGWRWCEIQILAQSSRLGTKDTWSTRTTIEAPLRRAWMETGNCSASVCARIKMVLLTSGCGRDSEG